MSSSILNDDHHTSHCLNCVNLNSCQGRAKCPIAPCPNKCHFRMHRCKLDQHLAETCPNQTIDCINRTNGCKFTLRRSDLAYHLLRCPANVVRCSSFSMRLIKNKSSSSQAACSWPDPIKAARSNLVHSNRPIECSPKTINQVFLERDYQNLKEFARTCPLRFQRMYGYLIGLKLDNLSNSAQQNKFLFMRYLLKNVKSRIFKDIESENCVVFNDELGCSACQVRIRMLEIKRFNQMKEKYKQFDVFLHDVDCLAEFVERRIYLDDKFLRVYNETYRREDVAQNERQPELTAENNRELFDQLLKRNNELIEAIELDSTLKLNVAKELPCEIFQLQYETYRTKESDFATDCDQLLRRDEFNDHYSFHHNNLMPNCDFIEARCPFSDYGCQYFARRIDFSHNCCKTVRLGFNESSGSFVFSFDQVKQSSRRRNYWDLDEAETNLNLLDLPFEVLYEIITHLDSNSLFNLSLTSKTLRNICEQFLQLRGIVYPKWTKSEPTDANNNESNSPKWRIDKYVYSFSRHIKTPGEVTMTTNMKRDFYEHVRTCPYRVVKELPERVKIFPPFF